VLIEQGEGEKVKAMGGENGKRMKREGVSEVEKPKEGL